MSPTLGGAYSGFALVYLNISIKTLANSLMVVGFSSTYVHHFASAMSASPNKYVGFNNILDVHEACMHA